MDILSSLKSPYRKNRKRRGRGFAAPKGKRGGRGTKGQRARSGSKRRIWFEGGQTPLIHRIPKRGFNNPTKIEYQVVNVDLLEKKFSPESIVDPTTLKEKKLIHGRKKIKILGRGEITKPLEVRVHKVSKKAKEKIEKVGGKVEEIKV
jgi:large subunit ribosomal protein L15